MTNSSLTAKGEHRVVTPLAASAAAELRDHQQGVRVIRDSLWNYTGQTVSAAVGLFTIPVLIRGLGAEGYGLWIATLAIASLLGTFDLGLGWAVMRAVGRSTESGVTLETQDFVCSVGNSFLLLGVASLVTMVALSGVLGLDLRLTSRGRSMVPAIFVLAGLFQLSDWISNYTSSVLGGLRRFDLTNLLGGAEAIGRAIGIVALVALGFPMAALVWIASWRLLLAVVAVVTIGHVEPHYRFRVARLRWRSVQPHLPFSLSSQITTALYTSLWQGPTLLISFLAGAAGLVPYHLGQKFPFLMRGTNHSGAEVVYAAAAADHDSQRCSQPAHILIVGIRWNLMVALPACILLTVFAPELLRAWLGQVDTHAVIVMRVTAAAVLVDSSCMPAMYLLWARGAVRAIATTLGVAAVVVASVTLGLMGAFGVAAGAIALLVGAIVFATVFFTLAVKMCNLRPKQVAGVVRGFVLPTTVCACSGWILAQSIQPVCWIALLACMAVAGGGFIGPYYLIGAGAEERKALQGGLELLRHAAESLYGRVPQVLARLQKSRGGVE
jgi:O-antigen/teichoic acid export membrane protein